MARGRRDIQSLAQGVAAGRRADLAAAITLTESILPEDREAAKDLLSRLWKQPSSCLRIGLSGAAGVGKSTLVDAIGLRILEDGLKLAVLAVDPSSTAGGGSVLADKTRMKRLSLREEAYIRPSPSGNVPGGVARRTREAIFLCEAAGYGAVIVETLGAGQAEASVAEMTDVYVLLVSPAGGDDLQGVKRGVLEHADLVLVTKEDGDLAPAARRTAAAYGGALRLWRRRACDPEDFPAVQTVSALEGGGVAEAWEKIVRLRKWRDEQGHTARQRSAQLRGWVRAEMEDQLLASMRMRENEGLPEAALNEVKEGRIDPLSAAGKILANWKEAAR